MSLYEFADVLEVICGGDLIMLANISCVCKAFYDKIGNCNEMLMGLVDRDYFNDGNVEEIINTYGYPKYELRKVHYVGLFEDIKESLYNVWRLTYYMFEDLLLAKDYDIRHGVIRALTYSEKKLIEDKVDCANAIKSISRYGISADMIKHMINGKVYV